MIRPLAAITVVVLAAFPQNASASPKVALTAIDGDSKDQVREAVAAALDGKSMTLIGMREVNRAYDKLGEGELSEKSAKKLAKELEADAIVQGKLEKNGGKKSLKFKLFVNGKKLKGFSVQFKSATSPKFQSMLRDKMIEKIEGAGGSDVAEEDSPKKKKGAAAEDEEDPLGKKGKKGKKVAQAEEEEEDPKAKKGKKGKKEEVAAAEEPEKKKKKASADEEEALATKKDPEEKEVAKEKDEAKEPAEDEDKPKKKKVAVADGEEIDGETRVSARSSDGGGAHSANVAAARADVGVSVMSRSLVFKSNLVGDEGPKPFRPSPVPGARFEADIFPLAFMDARSVASGLGLGVKYDKTLSMKLSTSAEPTVAIPVKAMHWSVAGKFRIAFGKTATSPTATIGFGYGGRLFTPDRTGLMDYDSLDLPNTNYKFFAPSLAFRFPIGTVVAIIAGGEGMLVRDAGGIQTAESYGKAKIFGFEASAGLDIVLGNRFAVRFLGEFNQVGFTFVGNGGVLANSRDGDPSDLDVGGAQDRSFGGAATLAVLY